MSVRIKAGSAHVAEVVMDRPEALNALSTEQLRALAAAATALAGDENVAAVILCSAVERAFCVGADLKERRGLDDEALAAQRQVFIEAFARLRALPMPVLAAVDGYALGGGCELALSCDVIVASASATFGLPEVGLGLIPGCGGTQLLPRRVGPGRAAELIFTGRRLDASEAYGIGLVDRLAEAAALDAARELAAAIATKSPTALRAAKRALRDGADRDLAEALAVESSAWDAVAFSADRAEGVEAFNAGRPPVWPSWSRPQTRTGGRA